MSAQYGPFKARVDDRLGADYGEVIYEVGTATFSTTDSQATYRTSLTEIVGGFVNITDTFSPATDSDTMDTVSIPLGAVTSGSITLTRSSKGSSGATYSVALFGRVF